MSDKETIRKELLRLRDSISPDEWTEKSNTIEKLILSSAAYKKCKKLFLYSDFNGEVGTLTLLEDALLNDKEVYLPKVCGDFNDNRMDFYRIYSGFELVPGYKGIKEPMDNPERLFDYDACVGEKMLMFVPGVAFDKNGNRLGYGKGYYDNYLKDKPAIIKCAIAFELQVKDSLPVNENDIRMDLVITENTKQEALNKLFI